MENTIPIIATVNSIREGNRAYRELADPETYHPMWGEEVGDEDAGRRLQYRVNARMIDGLDSTDTIGVFRAQDNVVQAEIDRRAFGVPEDLPKRMPEVEDLGAGAMVPEEAVLRYAGSYPFRLFGSGAVYQSGLEVAVLDTGLDSMWASKCFAAGNPFIANHKQFTDEAHMAVEAENFHGTHCMGLLAAGTRLKINVAQVLGDDGSGYTSWIMDGLYWAIRQGCRVASLSLGGGHYSQAMADAVAYARRRGCLVVCAMGNDGVMEREYPAAYPGATGIIASSHFNEMRAPFSNYGDWAHGTTDGVSVLSWGLDGALVRASGTSMATPLYARVLALLIAEHGSPSTVLKVAGATAHNTPEPVVEEGNGRIFAQDIDDELRR